VAPPESTEDDKPNKRRHPRFIVEGVQGKMVFASQVEILNLSLGGVAIRADRRLNIGGEYTLKLELGGEDVEIKGLVVWSVMSGMHKASERETVPEYSAGLRFKDVFTERLLKLMAFIDRHKVFEEHRVGGLRFRIDAPGKALLDSPEEYRVRLISRSGMLIETQHTLHLDKIYPMEISPPDSDRIRFDGRVASAVEVEDDARAHFEYGIEFLALSAEDDARLQAFIEALAKRQ
jgi:hypothetical protein